MLRIMFQWHERVMLRWKLENGLWNDEQIFSFFETPGKRRLRVGIALALILVGLALFLWQIDDVAALEQSRRAPVQVEALIDVEVEHGANTYYTEYISYECDGIVYDRIFLRSGRSPLQMERDGETELVNLDPRDHGKLEQDMVKDNWFLCSVLMMALGVSMLVYCAALGSDRIRRWLVAVAAKDCRRMDNPDYLPDLVILTIAAYLVMTLVLLGFFPLAVGFAPSFMPLLLLVSWVPIRIIFRLSERNQCWEDDR